MRLPEIYPPEEVASVINNDDRLKRDPHAKEQTIGNSQKMEPFVKREVMPGKLDATAMQEFKNAAGTYFHESCTAHARWDGTKCPWWTAACRCAAWRVLRLRMLW